MTQERMWYTMDLTNLQEFIEDSEIYHELNDYLIKIIL